MMRNVHLNIFDRLMGYRTVHHRFCEQQPNRIGIPRGITQVLKHDEWTGTYQNEIFGNLTISSVRQQLYLTIGRFGNASIHCWTSTTVCELEFHGILWWISDSDAFHNDRETNRTVIFEICRGRVQSVVLPLYSTEVPPVFTWIAPEGKGESPQCNLNKIERHQTKSTSANPLQLTLSSTGPKIDRFSAISIFALVVFHHILVRAIHQMKISYRL
jgi:hypothetical protein